MNVPKPLTVPLEEECPCMSVVRSRNEKYFKNANKVLEFYYPTYELNEEYFSGYYNCPISYIFTYRNVYGTLSHEKCKCKTNWKTEMPKETYKELKQFAYMHKKCMESELCQCGQNLINYLDKFDEMYSSHYCRTVPVNPNRHIYRQHGIIQSCLCTCSNTQVFEPIEDSSESESESEADEEYERE